MLRAPSSYQTTRFSPLISLPLRGVRLVSACLPGTAWNAGELWDHQAHPRQHGNASVLQLRLAFLGELRSIPATKGTSRSAGLGD